MAHQIVPLDKKDWKGAVLPIGYTTDTIYEVQLVRRSTGFSISIEQKALDAPITHTPQEYDLETQSCNANAIGFYLHEGFTLIGLDTICYSNRDLTRDQVRLELGWMLEENKE